MGVPALSRAFDATWAASARRGDVRQVSQGQVCVLRVLGGQHDSHPAVQLVEVEGAQGVVLSQQADKALPVGVAGLVLRPARGRRPAGRRRWHGYSLGRTTTAVP
jgi:hypothetical protein